MWDTLMTALLWSLVVVGYAYSVWKLGKVWRDERLGEVPIRVATVVPLRPRRATPSRTIPARRDGRRQRIG